MTIIGMPEKETPEPTTSTEVSPAGKRAAWIAIAVVLLLVAIAIGVPMRAQWQKKREHREAQMADLRGEVPGVKPIDAIHVGLMWRDGLPSLEERDKIRALEKKGYRFRGSYEVKNWTYLVYEKD
jgi:hypothetical protein